MDRRKFSLLAATAFGAPLATLSACGGGSDAATDGVRQAEATRVGVESATSPTLKKWHATPNPTGLRVGFWENFDRQDLTLSSMGRRPSSRVGFNAWDDLESPKGVYSDPPSAPYANAHRYGESILGAINICFRIPSRYPNDISDPVTSAAAENFLAHHVEWLLRTFGSLVLTIDYEIVSNYLLKDQPDQATVEKRANDWQNWYVNHAVPTARRVALGLNMQDKLKLQPIFNGNPLADGHPVANNAVVKEALRKVVAASDYLALDTYFSDMTLNAADPARTIDTIKFWYETYAKPNHKEVVVTENGFSSITEIYPGITRKQRDGKYTGTEAQQAAYFSALFKRLMEENRAGGVFENKLRGFHVWSIVDNNRQALDDGARYLGLHRLAVDTPPTPKPAAKVVKDAISLIENDRFHQPAVLAEIDGTNLWGKLHRGLTAVDLRYSEGDDHDFLRYVDTGPGSRKTPRLRVTVAHNGNLLLRVNDAWQLAADPAPLPNGTFSFDVDISASYLMSGSNTIDVYATGQVFPVLQQIQLLDIVYI